MNKWIVIILCVLIGSLCFLAGCFWNRRRYKRKLQKLNLLLDTVMRGNYTPDWSPYQEGEISILVNQLELVVKRTEHAVKQLSCEKSAIRDFIADISHQIKTPLTGLLSDLDLLESAETDSTKQQRISECIYLTERINELIRSLLELAKLDSDTVRLQVEAVSAKKLIDSAIETARLARPKSDCQFSCDIDTSAVIRCDKKWIQQALVNILVNAMDYSEGKPPIHISVNQRNSLTMIKIADHGGGLEEADLQNIFKRFYRSNSSKSGGFGIGLSMAESIVRLHKGNIRAVNEDDGLAIILTIPSLICAESFDSNLTVS